MISVGLDARPNVIYSIYQFPPHEMPRIDGDFSDWSVVPDSFAIGLDQMKETVYGRGDQLDPEDYNIKVKVAWVKGLNRLYFYLQAYDDNWVFDDLGLRQDIFELVVDADVSGGNFIKKSNPNQDLIPVEQLHFRAHGAHAQNYHIFTPAVNKDWAMVWGNTPWIKDFPYANVASDYSFKQGESGVLRMEFWITPFDYAAVEGIHRSVLSQLKENEIIKLSWCILEFDTAQKKAEAFINLAHDTDMIRNGDVLNAFRLRPLEASYTQQLVANWSFREVNRDLRTIAFFDQSQGDVEVWHWDFGDGTHSNEKNPIHHYTQAGEWTVVLTVENQNDKSVRSKVWDVVTQ